MKRFFLSSTLSVCLFTLICLYATESGAPPPPSVSMTKNADIYFGFLDYDSTHSGTLSLGTNGVMTVTGTGLSSDNNTQAGRVTITSSSGTVEIKCEADGKMKNGNKSLEISNTEIAIDTGVAFGSGIPCEGIKNANPVAATVDLAANPTPVIYIGGKVTIGSGSLESGTYSTTSGGGSPVTLRVVFQ